MFAQINRKTHYNSISKQYLKSVSWQMRHWMDKTPDRPQPDLQK